MRRRGYRLTTKGPRGVPADSRLVPLADVFPPSCGLAIALGAVPICADSQLLGIENSLQPQSRHTRTSGEGVMGGWLMVRVGLRYSRTSAGITEIDSDWHFGQVMETPQKRIPKRRISNEI